MVVHLLSLSQVVNDLDLQDAGPCRRDKDELPVRLVSGSGLPESKPHCVSLKLTSDSIRVSGLFNQMVSLGLQVERFFLADVGVVEAEQVDLQQTDC